jgi:hypothetical protein
MHALFHIKTVIIMRDRYRPEGFSPRVDIGRGMITVQPHDVTSAQLSIVVWKMSTFGEERFVGVSEAEPSTDIDHSYP